MITYNLLIKLQDSSKENVDKAKTVLLSMQGKIEYIRDRCLSRQLSHEPENRI